MTTLYRTPNIIIDAHEWHATVRYKAGRTLLQYRWRPLSGQQYQWLPITSWVGPKPKGLSKRFAKYRRHIDLAMSSESRRREAAALVRALPTGTMLRNVGKPLEVAA
jgi:hypothetical protein